MSYLVKHSTLGTLLRYIGSGKISYRRGPAPSGIDLPALTAVQSATPRPSASTEKASVKSVKDKDFEDVELGVDSATPRPSGLTEGYVDDKDDERLAVTSTDNIVDWSGPDDPNNPQNWPFSQKLAITAILWYVS